ncbi:MAG: hypothetical protein RMN24_00820 [Anaerolineae bacterium]|nr:hypothetical protein [Caldilineales bacterium]MDW8267682.1 hypothetical protein [Anaerolineae bacterium]
MKRVSSGLWWGVFLILLGLLFLLHNLGLIRSFRVGPMMATPAFAVGGAAFLAVYLRRREHWWALIPGFTLLGLSLLVGLGMISPVWADRIGPALFLGSIGLSFWLIYLLHRRQWWALIPGGVLFTLALVTLGEDFMGAFLGKNAAAVLLFFGMAFTFLLVALLPGAEMRMTWAFIPAGFLFVIGLFLMTESWRWLSLLGPLALIALGGYLLARGLLRR